MRRRRLSSTAGGHFLAIDLVVAVSKPGERPTGAHNFGCQNDLVSLLVGKPLANVLFRLALGLGLRRYRVELGGVDEIDAALQRIVELLSRVLQSVLLPECHRAKADFRDGEFAVAELVVFHGLCRNRVWWVSRFEPPNIDRQSWMRSVIRIRTTCRCAVGTNAWRRLCAAVSPPTLILSVVCLWTQGGLCTLGSVFAQDAPNRGADEEENLPPVQPAADAPKPLSPAESAARMQLPDGFRIELVASEPLIADPSCIAFDERGRLFVCELHGYNIEGYLDVQELNKTGVLDKEVRRLRWELQGGKIAEEAAKRQYGSLKLLLDDDKDGRMDRVEVWADDLPPCYGVVAANRGVLVVCAPHIYHFPDRDGDGRPEERVELFRGFQLKILERGINNPRWGLDNWIYVGAGSEGATVRGPNLGESVRLGRSDFRLRADGSALEPVNGSVGTFGMTINSIGDRFPATGGRPATYALPLPRRYLARNPHVSTPSTTHHAASHDRGYRISDPHPWRVRRRQDPAWIRFYGNRETDSNYFTGGCSNEFYGDRLFPKEYRGNLFYCEPSLNIVHRTILERDGAGYRARRAPGEETSEFLASKDQWFRPMNLRVGPEGALYVVDMYREIIEDYSAIPRFLQQQYGLEKGNDKGRIWRLVPDRVAVPREVDLGGMDEETLATTTQASEAWRRMTAQRLLIERGASDSTVELLREFLRLDDGTSAGGVHALYTLDGLHALEPVDVVEALKSRHFAVRLHALRLADRWLEGDSGLVRNVAALADDPDPSVRLQAALTLGESSSPVATEALITLAETYGTERWMAAAIVSSSHRRAGELLAALLSAERLSDGAQAVLTPLAKTVAGKRAVADVGRVLTACAGVPASVQERCLEGLAAGLSSLKPADEDSGLPAPDGWACLSPFLANESEAVKRLAAKIASRVEMVDGAELEQLFAAATRTAADASAELHERRRALQVLANAPFDVLAEIARDLLSVQTAPTLRAAAVEALRASTDVRVGKLLLDDWTEYTPAMREAVLRAVLSQENRWEALLDAVERKTVRVGEINASRRERLLLAQNPEIVRRAKVLMSEPSSDAELRARLDRYQRALEGERDVVQGEAVFRKVCISCHVVGGEGHEVGPSLGSMTNKPDASVLVDILDPGAHIESAYRSYVVVTHRGESLTGVLTSESPTSVTLRQEKGVEAVILRQDIRLLRASEVSLMPSNIHEQVSPRQLADLLAFLRAKLSES